MLNLAGPGGVGGGGSPPPGSEGGGAGQLHLVGRGRVAVVPSRGEASGEGRTRRCRISSPIWESSPGEFSDLSLRTGDAEYSQVCTRVAAAAKAIRCGSVSRLFLRLQNRACRAAPNP